MKLNEIIKYWWIPALIAIFLFAFWIRQLNTVPDRILSYDPVFQYRFTKYIADFGVTPLWDELSYYVGRAVSINNYPPLMWYITAFVYKLFAAGATLKTTAAFMGAVFGAMITIPAFLLGRELSNKYGGLMAALLVGTAPQILVRTFGSSFDNDQLVLFFILLTTYLGIYAMRKRTVGSVSLAVLGFTAFAVTWGVYWYPFFVLAGTAVIYFLLGIIFGDRKTKMNFDEKIKHAWTEGKRNIAVLVSLFAGIFIAASLLSADPLGSIGALFGFAGNAEKWIVNISIAELQPAGFALANIGSWITMMGRFAVGDALIDILIFLAFTGLIIFGLAATYKKNIFRKAALLALLAISLFTVTAGTRFTEFTSGFMIILVAAGFGYLVDWTSKKGRFPLALAAGLGLAIVFTAASLGYATGLVVGPDQDANWDGAWNFLKTQTPQDSLVGTWWDPGHMVTGLAERRVVADGAHCGFDCKYTINDRIVDLGKTFATNNENESVQIIRKYQGDSPKVYWIASDDLIGKFQWLQYYGTGCDARSDQKCPLYYQLPQQSVRYTLNGDIGLRDYGNVIILPGKVPLALLKQETNAAFFAETLYYDNGEVKNYKLDSNITELMQQIKPVTDQLGLKLSQQPLPVTVWVRSDYAYAVIIPQNLRNNIFTKMFFLEGAGLSDFKQVFRNEEVKIYEVTALEGKN